VWASVIYNLEYRTESTLVAYIIKTVQARNLVESKLFHVNLAAYGTIRKFKNNEEIWQLVWRHFLKFLWEKDGQSAECKLCKNKLKIVGGSTQGRHEHLR